MPVAELFPRVLLIALLSGAVVAQVDTPTSAKSNEAESIARDIESTVAKYRGLEFKSPTKIGLYTKEELKAFLLDQAKTEMPDELIDHQQRALRLLGLFPADIDLKKLTIELLEEQVAGFYNPDKKELFLIKVAADDESGKSMNRSIMSHELVHALQDQHFDLGPTMKKFKSDSDRLIAMKSVVEGDAMYTMMLFQAKESGQELTPEMLARQSAQMPTTLKDLAGLLKTAKSMGLDAGDTGMGSLDVEKLTSSPAVLGDELIFSYMGGLRFCAQIVAKSDAKTCAAIDAAFKKLPMSTEQIMHPDKYVGATPDWPTTVSLPNLAALAGEGFKESYSDTLGELHVRTLLNQFKQKRVATTHGGWDGDRYVFFKKTGAADFLVWVSTWDTPTDADEFAVALRDIAQKMVPDQKPVDSEDGTSLWIEGDLATAVATDAKNVFFIRRAPRSTMKPIIAALKNDTKYIANDPTKD